MKTCLLAFYPWHELWAPANVPNWGLFLIGLAGTTAAVWTLRVIKSQASTMESQAAIMKAQTELTERTLVLQYRPRVVIRIENVLASNFAPLGSPSEGRVMYSVSNTGGSVAHIVDSRVTVEVLNGEQKIPYYLHNLRWVEVDKLEAGESKMLPRPLRRHLSLSPCRESRP